MLDARQLEALEAVLDHGGFGAAAQALKLTMAAVSLRIRALESAMGTRLVVRGKAARATPAGQALLAHVKQLRLMEADLVGGLAGARSADRTNWQALGVAVNADSLASWFLPGVAASLSRYRLTLQATVDDQDHTHDALKHGEVVGCVSTLAKPMRGCVAEPLGTMRYRCVAIPSLAQKCRTKTGVSVHRLLALPAVVFNRKDALQDAFLLQHFGLASPAYPRHYVPAVDAFEIAVEQGMGWGMVPDLLLARRAGRLQLQEVLPGSAVDVALYWHHWEREPASAQRLTQAVLKAGRAALIAPSPARA